ncbi:MAG: DEAD-box ATP-dependent RNA helicase DeaD (CshA) [uncultured Chthoniobacterales bacterium]|uniref:DEAD-box ATP-dependent RNA helicase RhpA n=1 Tax=uncultured Chthoniobacterales bacterium TaxID=1836801 RepID=A0A6J4J3H5_9BACT|nr:MAG: DEAD-box ATP-dependent RNA helicase DeaD (CshA) [uncultured Chthoniobacterales bacterium]
MQKKPFTELGLAPEILKAVERMGFEEASPIQCAAIPVLLEGSDVVGQSQTGSGKTAAFGIPAIQAVDPALRAPQVIILCPTRELVVQVAEEIAKLAFFKRGVRELPIYGGQSYERQFRGLSAGAQIIIGTPGRVMDHLERKSLRLDQIKMVVLDEADRMLDMGFVDDIKTILRETPDERQTVFFSATIPRPIQELIKTFTRDPVSVRMEAQALTVPAIEQIYYEVDRRSKLEVLCRLIDLEDVKLAIIFCATKMMVDELTEHLQARGYSADKLHGDMTQAMRERVMGKFRKRAIEILVATDVAARGLDIDDIEVVFNYDLPHDGEDYVHRIGRTGRAGKGGKAVTFVAGREIYRLENIQRFTKSRIRRAKIPSAEEVEDKRATAFAEALRETLEKGEYKRHDELLDRLLEQGHSPTDIASALIHLLGEEKPRAAAAPVPEDNRRSDARSYPDPGARDRRERGRDDFDGPPPRDRAERPPRSGPREEAGTVSHEPGMVRLAFNVGRAHQVQPGDFVGVIIGVTAIPKSEVGAIHLQATKTLVDVAEARVELVLKKLNGIQFKGRKLAVRPAAEGAKKSRAAASA